MCTTSLGASSDECKKNVGPTICVRATSKSLLSQLIQVSNLNGCDQILPPGHFICTVTRPSFS